MEIYFVVLHFSTSFDPRAVLAQFEEVQKCSLLDEVVEHSDDEFERRGKSFVEFQLPFNHHDNTISRPTELFLLRSLRCF